MVAESRPEDSSRRSSDAQSTLAAAGEARRAGRRRGRGVIAMMRVCRCVRLESFYLIFCFTRKVSSFELGLDACTS
jgi:hypothetical protein